MEPRSYDFTVLPQWIDFTGKCRFSTIVSNILDVAGMDARRNGFGIDVLAPRNMGWVLSRLCVELDSRPLEHDAYTVVTWVKGYTPLLSTRCFQFLDAEGKCFGRAVSVWCLLDYTERHPVPMSTIMDIASKSVTPKDEPCPAPRKIRPFDAPVSNTHKVKYMDIDFNRHMNTLRYIDLVVDELPLDVSSSDEPMRVDVHFVKESVCGDVLNVYCTRDGQPAEKGETYHTAIRKEDGTLVILADFFHSTSSPSAQ